MLAERLRSSATAVAVALIALIAGCAAPDTAAEVPEATLAPARVLSSQDALRLWQRRLDTRLASTGQGGPAALAELPALRDAARLRPSQILFGVTDVNATAPGRDGLDVVGLMVDRHEGAAGIAYVFVVGVIQRQSHRPVALLDLRVMALTLPGGEAAWWTGLPDPQALSMYQQRRGSDGVLQFPGRFDDFKLQRCPSGACVEERNSGARWAVHGLSSPG